MKYNLDTKRVREKLDVVVHTEGSLKHLVRCLCDEIDIERASRRWRPIETAPKDGTEVLLGWQTEESTQATEIGEWRSISDTWIDRSGSYLFEPTHWMPLPAPPEKP